MCDRTKHIQRWTKRRRPVGRVSERPPILCTTKAELNKFLSSAYGHTAMDTKRIHNIQYSRFSNCSLNTFYQSALLMNGMFFLSVSLTFLSHSYSLAVNDGWGRSDVQRRGKSLYTHGIMMFIHFLQSAITPMKNNDAYYAFSMDVLCELISKPSMSSKDERYLL